MAPKKKKPTTTSMATKAQSAPSETLLTQRFETELQSLAAKARNDTWENRAVEQLLLLLKSAILLALLGVWTNASQLNLTPIYGAVSASQWHHKVVMAGCFVGWAANIWMWRVSRVSPPQLLPVMAIYVPTTQFFLSKLADTLTARWGPLVTELLTLFPLLVVTASSVATYLEGVDLGFVPRLVAEAAPGLMSWGTFRFVESAAAAHLRAYVGRTFFHTRVGLEILLAAVYTVIAPSKLLLFAVPALVHTALFNTHVMLPSATEALKRAMLDEKWVLLDRRESVTGYVAVVESLDVGYKVMRCDHSLLGGEWTKIKTKTGGLAEPVYAVFTMLESVRLVEVSEPVPDDRASALVIGLGVGTTPSAFIMHGIDTTVVEIDPVVYEFARKHFGLPANHTAVVEDASRYTAALVEGAEKRRFDYIVHDVFTGGAEPIDLFTFEFLQGLHHLLNPNGVVVINYAGDLLAPSAGIVLHTVRQVFPSCKVFRELERNAEAVEKEGRDFTNMVIFCKKSEGPVVFRKPQERDFLGSRSRQSFLLPRHELVDSELQSDEEPSILSRNDTSKLAKWHQHAALGHWSLMRTVLPPEIWDKW